MKALFSLRCRGKDPNWTEAGTQAIRGRDLPIVGGVGL